MFLEINLLLGGSTNPSEKYELVNWDDDYQLIGKIKVLFQTTNQFGYDLQKMFGDTCPIPKLPKVPKVPARACQSSANIINIDNYTGKKKKKHETSQLRFVSQKLFSRKKNIKQKNMEKLSTNSSLQFAHETSQLVGPCSSSVKRYSLGGL